MRRHSLIARFDYSGEMERRKDEWEIVEKNAGSFGKDSGNNSQTNIGNG